MKCFLGIKKDYVKRVGSQKYNAEQKKPDPN